VFYRLRYKDGTNEFGLTNKTQKQKQQQHMTMKQRIIAGAVLALAGASLTGSAQSYTYLDATFGTGANTTLANGSALTTTGTDAADGIWRLRAFGSSGSIIEASGNAGAENCPEIRTTISGLTIGQTYQVYVNFWDPGPNDQNQIWNIRGGFSSNPGANTLFASPNDALFTSVTPGLSMAGSTAAVQANSLTYSTAPTIFGPDSGRILYAGLLGTAVADNNGQIQVFVDDQNATVGANRRTWYDGVSFAAVPEPSSIALAGIGLAGLLIFRRRSA
jgi:hypothetical protein